MQSFEVQTTRPEPILEAIVKEAGPRRSKGIIILTGAVTSLAPHLARALAQSLPLGRWLLVSAAGALSERGELDGETGVVGMKLPSSTEILLEERPNVDFGTRLGQDLRSRPGSSACAFVAAPFGEDEWLVSARNLLRGTPRHLIGGGTMPGLPVWGAFDGQVVEGRAGALVLSGATTSQVCSSSACRLLSSVGRVTKAKGQVIHEIDGIPALERLGQSTVGLEEQSLVLLALAASERPLAATGRALALRPIQGVDPSRGSLLLGEEIEEGRPVAFAVRDSHGARSDFEAQLRTLRRESNGAAPGFGLYISCAGRGRALYKTPHVDTRLIRNQFPNMPFVGMHSTFEIAPLEGRSTPQVYAGVLSVFSLPS